MHQASTPKEARRGGRHGPRRVASKAQAAVSAATGSMNSTVVPRFGSDTSRNQPPASSARSISSESPALTGYGGLARGRLKHNTFRPPKDHRICSDKGSHTEPLSSRCVSSLRVTTPAISSDVTAPRPTRASPLQPRSRPAPRKEQLEVVDVRECRARQSRRSRRARGRKQGPWRQVLSPPLRLPRQARDEYFDLWLGAQGKIRERGQGSERPSCGVHRFEVDVVGVGRCEHLDQDIGS